VKYLYFALSKKIDLMDDNILEIKSLTKRYDQHLAVDQVSLSVPRGGIFGLLGPNGAGKTSLIRMITTITQPDEGEIWFDGHLMGYQDTQKMGYLPEERGLYKKMDVFEQLIFLARLKGLEQKDAKKKVKEWLERLGIAEWGKKMVEELSKGMQQKIQFIAAVVNEPIFLILDEPFSGLDPINASLLREEILELHRKGTTIILSTHRMEQVEEFCQRIALINRGKNVLMGEVQDLRQQFKENIFEFSFETLPSDEILKEYEQVVTHANTLSIQLQNIAEANAFVVKMIKMGHILTAMKEVLPGMNEIFIKQVKRTSL
jgi:ABC-2 type transport system ATP-binding protein